jgi:hypothetical protein
MHEVRLVYEQHGERALTSEIFDVFAEGVEYVACGSAVRNVEGVADVAVEVAAAEGDVVAVGQPERLIGAERVAQGAQDACFADAGLSGDDSVFALVHAGNELVDEAALALGEPQLAVVDFLENGSLRRPK